MQKRRFIQAFGLALAALTATSGAMAQQWKPTHPINLIVPWAAGYLFYVAVSHLVWSEASPHGRGWPIGLVQAAVISGLGYFLLCIHELEGPSR